MKILFIKKLMSEITRDLSFCFLVGLTVFGFNVCAYAIRYNAGFEIVKNRSVPNFSGFDLQYSYDLAQWKSFEEKEGLNLNCYYGGLVFYFDSETVYLRFQKEQAKNVVTNDLNIYNIATYLRSDIYYSSFDKKRTHFLSFDTSGITNSASKSKLKCIDYTPGKPPRYYYLVDFHFETLTNSYENNYYPININRIIQTSNHIQLDWSLHLQQPSPITYYIGIGFLSFGSFTNIPTTETSYTWYPPRTGKYWVMLRAEDQNNDTYYSEPVSFVYIEPGDSSEIDSDQDGFSDVEELLRNSDPDDPLDMPVIILSDTNSVLEIRKDMYFYKELFVKKNLSVSWESVGILPAGMSFNEQGILSGVPEACGIFPIEINAYSMMGNHFDTISLNITVSQPEQSVVKVGTGEIKTNP